MPPAPPKKEREPEVSAAQAAEREAEALVAAMRAQPGPAFMECRTYRWLEHVGPWFDHELKRTYRTKEEVDGWMAACPVTRSAAYLQEQGWATQAELDAWETTIRADQIRNSDFPVLD